MTAFPMTFMIRMVLQSEAVTILIISRVRNE